MNLQSKKALVVDHGLFVELARVLGRQFGTVYYHTPSARNFAVINEACIGYGLPEIELVDSPFRVLDEVDVVIFPDVGMGAMQDWLAKRGMRVWGSRLGENLEQRRADTKRLQQALGLPVGPYTIITGIEALRAFLQKHKRQFVKWSTFRGNFETLYARDYSYIAPKLVDVETQLGPLARHAEFIVEQQLPDCVEIGIDGYCIDGKFPSMMLNGVEIKDRSYILKADKRAEMPEQLTRYDDAIKPVLKQVQYRGFYSTEIRVTEKGLTPYMLDHCARCGSPPSEIYQNIYGNLGEIIYQGADGVLVEPRLKAQWGAELLICSEWAAEHWQPVEIPKQYRDLVKLRNVAQIDGKLYVVPQPMPSAEIGAVVGFGNSMRAAVEMALEVADSVKGYDIEINHDSLEDGEAVIGRAREIGLRFMGK